MPVSTRCDVVGVDGKMSASTPENYHMYGVWRAKSTHWSLLFQLIKRQTHTLINKVKFGQTQK
jgi:hypothetical protein